MTQLLLPPFTRAIVDQDGMLTQEARVFFSNLVERIPIYGEGTPEGVVKGQIGSTFYDLDAVAGSRVYLKINANIGGDTTKGWELES